MPKLGFLGLGAMGTPMARRLIEAGHEVTVWNRTRARAEAIEGAAGVAGTPADAARGADAVITMLATPDVVEEVLLGQDGVVSGAGSGTALIEMSTIGPDHVLDLAAKVPPELRLIDAPVLGGVRDAVNGTLRVLVGGTDDDFARHRDTLAAIGTPIHFGPTGSAAAMKLVYNAALAGLMALIGEALLLGDGFELDQEQVIERLVDSPIGPALSRKLDNIEHDRYPPSFKLSLMLKDMRLLMEAAERRGVGVKLVRDATDWLRHAHEQGLDDRDYSAVVADIRGREANV